MKTLACKCEKYYYNYIRPTGRSVCCAHICAQRKIYRKQKYFKGIVMILPRVRERSSRISIGDVEEGVSPSYNQYVSPRNLHRCGRVAHGLVCGSAIWLGRQYGSYSHVGPLHRNQRDFWLLLVTKVTYEV